MTVQLGHQPPFSHQATIRVKCRGRLSAARRKTNFRQSDDSILIVNLKGGRLTVVARAVRVLCVDDNFLVAEGIRIKLALAGGFEWLGQLADAENLVAEVERLRPDIVLLDIDMPGKDALAALDELSAGAAGARVIVVSGHVRGDLIDRAVGAGAWGYLFKGEGTDTLVPAIQQVLEGRFVMGPEASADGST